MTAKFPAVSLKNILVAVQRPEAPIAGKAYRQIGVKLWGQGAYERTPIDGGQTRYSTLYQVQPRDVIVNKIWARNGSVAVVPENLAGCYGSSEFPTFVPTEGKLHHRWFHWLTKTTHFWEQCNEKSYGSSGKNRIRSERFLEIEVPLPPLDEQRRIVKRIERLAGMIGEARTLRTEVASGLHAMLVSMYSEITKGAKYLPMLEVAPLVRRSVRIDPETNYFELGIRSFGMGTFHKPPVAGVSLGTKRIFTIDANDLLFNIVFAWEGAVAVAKQEDHGRVGSHRFLTCLPKSGLATSSFLCFHFLTEQGLNHLGEASPGGAGRNRTLGLKALERIRVPVPAFDKQIWFDAILAKTESLKLLQAKGASKLDALLPSILTRAFAGEL